MEREAPVLTDWSAEPLTFAREPEAEDRTCRHLWSVLLLLIFSVTGVAVGVAVALGRAAPPGDNLTYVSQPHNQASKINLYDGKHGFVASLTRLDAGEDSPVWSPDGRQMAFVSWRDGQRNLFVMDTETRATRKVSTLRVALHDQLVWSPDSRRIAFEFDDNGDVNLAIVDLDGGTLEMLAVSPEPDRYPAWSPNGKRIVFVSWRNGNAELYLADLTCGGSLCVEPINATHTHGSDAYPSWSPDGENIAFLSDRSGYREVYVMSSTCGFDTASCNRRVRLLTDDSSKANDQVWEAPAWSPDGRKLAFLSDNDDTNVQIRLIDVAAAQARSSCCEAARQLTVGPWDNTNVAWSLDGARLAFTSYRNGNWDIFTVDSNGSDLTRVTSGSGDDYAPAWMPKSPQESLFTAFSFLR